MLSSVDADPSSLGSGGLMRITTLKLELDGVVLAISGDAVLLVVLSLCGTGLGDCKVGNCLVEAECIGRSSLLCCLKFSPLNAVDEFW